MSSFLERIRGLSQKQLAVLALRLNEELEQAGRRERQPIAVVGIGCRFPGGITGPDDFWRLLDEGREAISEVPAERWDSGDWFDPDPATPGRMSAKLGGFLDDVAGFDAESFGITPREAATMDPQQRLLLEVAWETLEHGGIDPQGLSGSATGVFVGVCNSDHFQRVLKRGAGRIDAYAASGNAPSVAAGRISYALGLTGPAITVDTACSSSLVALHQAIGALRNGSCDLALAGGVNVICEPDTMVSLSKAGMLAPDGRCKAFDATADGFARGEGCGVIALKRLEDAQRDNDRICAVIRGSALNQDGRSAGLTVPSRHAQEAVIRAALADAGVAPEEVGYIEAHGTGTRLGDPIEIRALSAALAKGRAPGRELIVGSAKTNFGHLESAAGIAGTIKAILSLQNGRIPQHLHFHHGNPEVDWDTTGIRIAATPRDWPAWAERRIAGVSSFGFSGTNAHVILESAPQEPAIPGAERVRCLPLSARTLSALTASAGQLGKAMTDAAPDFAATAATLSSGRAHLPERLTIVAGSTREAAEVLDAVAAGRPDDRALRGRVEPGENTGVVFLCTGQGAQYPGMARSLFESAPVFREIVERCDAEFGVQGGLRLIDVMQGRAGDASLLHRTDWTQPALYAVECGLAALWRSWGIEPAAVIGHSAGELAAASIAGVFTLEDGLRLAAERGRLLSRLPEGGAMAALFMSEDDARRAIAPYADAVSIAAVNARDSVVISGSARGIDATLSDLERAGVRGHRLHISFAAHSPMVDGALDDMERAAAGIAARAPEIPVAWNLTGGRPLPAGVPDAGYWRRHLREPVRFAEGMAQLRGEGHRVFLELGPHPVLAALAARDTDTLAPAERPVYLGSLRRDHDDWTEMSRALAGLYVQGVPVDWAATFEGQRPRPVALPTYPFEHKRFWIEPAETARRAAPALGADGGFPGGRLDTPEPIFETSLSTGLQPWLNEHRVRDSAIVAGPVYLSLAVAAAETAMSKAQWDVADFSILAPLHVEETPRAVQTRLTPEADGGLSFVIHSRARDVTGADWVKHASGRLQRHRDGMPLKRSDMETAARQLSDQDAAAAHLERLEALGIRLSGRFRTLDRLHRKDGEVIARIGRPEGAAGIDTPFCDAALLDGVLQAAGAALPENLARDGRLFFLTGIGSVSLAGPLPNRCWCHARLRPGSDGAFHDVDVTLYAEDGTGIGTLEGIRLTAAEHRATEAPRHYRIEWEEAPLTLPAAHALRAPETAQARLEQVFDELADRHGLDLYDRLIPALDEITRAHIVTALQALGWDTLPGGRHEVETLADRLALVPGQRRLFRRLLQILSDAGLIALDSNEVEVRALPKADAAARHAQAEAEFGRTPELSILERCGAALAGVLTGTADALDCLFPGGSLAEARELYVDAPFARTYNGALGALLGDLTRDAVPDQPLRILEIGAGTGGTTHEALKALDGHAVEYHFTDLSEHFLEAARDRFGGRDGFTTGALDIERDPAQQGLAPGCYDIVLAANVLHATRDLGTTLSHAAGLLAPGGALVLLEGVRPEPWVDVTFGMTPGWWRFTDHDLRPDYPLIAPQDWRELLARSGLTGTATVGGFEDLGRGAAQQMLIAARKPLATPRRVALLGAAGDLGAALARALADEGAEVVEETAEADDLIDLSVLHLAELAETAPHLDRQIEEAAVLSPLKRLQDLAARGTGQRLWIATRGMNPIGDEVPHGGARWQSPVAGLARVAALEVPASWGGLVDLDPAATTEAQARAIAQSVLFGDDDDQIAWRGDTRYVPRLGEVPAPAALSRDLDPAGTYLVTGGFGGIGALLGKALAERGAGRVALLGRNPEEDGPAMAAIRDAGAEALALQADVTDEASLRAAFEVLASDGPPLRGAFHAAAHLDAAPLGDLDEESVRAMLRPKISGTLALQRLLAEQGADFLALFSSTTSVLGAPGFAHYAAANAFLDASATQKGLRTFTVGWGTWESMRLASEETRDTYGAQGLRPMPADAALQALFALVDAAADHSLVASIDWERLVTLHETRRPRPMLSQLGGPAAPTLPTNTRPEEAAPVDQSEDLRSQIENAPAAARLGIIESAVAAEAAAAMGRTSGDDVARNRGLFDMGMDSLMSVELRTRLERVSGLTLPATLTFNHPTVSALAGLILTRLDAAERPAVSPPPAPAPMTTPPQDDIGTLDDEDLVARLRARLEELQ